MEWWHRMVKRPLDAVVASRVKTPKDGGGILKLHEEVQTCEYRDVQVMWEMMMVRRSEREISTATKRTAD